MSGCECKPDAKRERDSAKRQAEGAAIKNFPTTLTRPSGGLSPRERRGISLRLRRATLLCSALCFLCTVLGIVGHTESGMSEPIKLEVFTDFV